MKQLETGGLIVAAGLSSRLNSFKPLLPLADSTIIRTIIASFQAAQVAPVAVVTGLHADRLQAHVADLGVECLLNQDYATTDMFRSVIIGLSYMQDKCQRLFFLPGDVPLFAVENLMRMVRSMEESGAAVVIPACNGRKGHPVLIDNRVIPELLAYTGDRGLKGAIDALGMAAKILELKDPGVILDADTPEDYDQLLNYANKKNWSPHPSKFAGA